MPLRDWLSSQAMTDENLRPFRQAASPDLRHLIRAEVLRDINPSELLARLQIDEVAVRNEISAMVDSVIARNNLLVTNRLRQELRAYMQDEILGLGPIEPFLKDPNVEEIMVNGSKQVWIARKRASGGLSMELTDVTFDDDSHVMHIVDRILGPIGRRVDESTPYVNARLPDGSRVNVIIPPLALNGPTVTIRKFPETFYTMEDLIGRFHSLNTEAAAFLEICVRGRLNCVISGGTGSGKTTLLNALCQYISNEERIITIEDTAELQVYQQKPHVVRLEARPPNVEGRGQVTIRDLVVNALRMRPDRIVVGECRAGEAIDMLQAMNTGHDGSLTTIHANSPEEVIFRLEAMCLMSGLDLPIYAIRQLISMAINIIIQQRRLPDGTRKITSITEVTGMDREQVSMQEIYTLSGDTLKYTGAKLIPRHIAQLRRNLDHLPNWRIFSDS